MLCKTNLILVVSVLLINQLQAQNSSDSPSKKAEAFYQKINDTILPGLKLYSKRVDCIINELKNENAIEKVNQSFYEFTPFGDGFNVSFIHKDQLLQELESSFEDANFSCTIVGYCAIILIVTVMLIVVACVSCLSKKK